MDNLNNIPNVGNWGDAASKLNDNFNKIKQSLTTVENVSKNNKGYFTSLSALNTAFPSPKAGQTAYVYDEASSTNYYIYNAVNGAWVASTVEAPSVGADLAEYTKTGGSTKTTQEIDDIKANHGYGEGETPKTLKEVESKITNDINIVKDYTSTLSDLPVYSVHITQGEYSVKDVYKSQFIPIDGLDVISITPRGEELYYAFLKTTDNRGTHHGTVDFSEGTTRETITTKTEGIVAPQDANYLWISKYTGVDAYASSVIINGYDLSNSLKENIRDSTNSLKENIGGIRDSTVVLENKMSAVSKNMPRGWFIGDMTLIKNDYHKSILKAIKDIELSYDTKPSWWDDRKPRIKVVAALETSLNFWLQIYFAEGGEPSPSSSVWIVEFNKAELVGGSIQRIKNKFTINGDDFHITITVNASELIGDPLNDFVVMSTPESDASLMFIDKKSKEIYIKEDEDELREVVDILINKYGLSEYTLGNNAGTTTLLDGVRTITTTNEIIYAGIRVLRNKTDFNNKLIKLQFEARGDNDAYRWGVGKISIDGMYLPFTPSPEWTKYSAIINMDEFADIVLIGTLESTPIGESIQIRNLSIREHEGFVGAFEENDAFNLQNAINSLDEVKIPVGEHIITDTISIPSGKRILGVKGKSILKYTGSGICLNIGTSNDVVMEDFTIIGNAPNTPVTSNLNPVAAGVVDDIHDADSESGVGTSIGIRLNGGERVRLNGLEITNFDAYGLYVSKSGKTYRTPNQYHNLYINNCYCALKTDNEAERASIMGCMFTLNQIGWYMASGTNMVTNCSFNANRVGLHMAVGINHAHGVISNSPFTHCSLYGFVAYKIQHGQLFTGCKIGWGDVFLYKSMGISFQSGQFVGLTITVDGGWENTSGVEIGNHSFCNNSAANSNSFIIQGDANVIRKGNFYINGRDSSNLNEA